MWACSSSLIRTCTYTCPLISKLPVTPPSTGLRRGFLSDKARSKSNNSSSARRVTFAARSTEIPTGSTPPSPLPGTYRCSWPSLQHESSTTCGGNYVTRSYVWFSLPSARFRFPMRQIDFEPAPIRTFEDGPHIRAAIRCDMRVSMLLLCCSWLLLYGVCFVGRRPVYVLSLIHI